MKMELNFLAAGILLASANACLALPVIITQPLSQTNAVGTTATFWVAATGTEPLAQPVEPHWRFYRLAVEQ